MPTHPIDVVFHRLWTLAAGLKGYVKPDWKTVNEAVVAHCYGGQAPGSVMSPHPWDANGVCTACGIHGTDAFLTPCPGRPPRRPFLAVSSEVNQANADVIRAFVDDLGDDGFQTPETDQGSRVLPGEWLCRTCGFKMSMRTMALAGDGLAVGVDATLKREECPNDGALMDQATEADVIEALNECVESWVDALEEAGGTWWHVTRELPTLGDRVLVAVRYEVGSTVTFGQLRSFNDREGKPMTHWTTEGTVGHQSGHVTHWKHIPEVPDEDLGAGPSGTCSVTAPE